MQTTGLMGRVLGKNAEAFFCERYYTRKFTSRKAVVSMINGYIYFYNNKRIQRKLHLLAPMKYLTQLQWLHD